jgi:hypothetical protein
MHYFAEFKHRRDTWDANYQPPRRLHALGELGGQVGVGMALVLEATTVLEALLLEEVICEEAAAPVRARTTTKARTMFFMM